VIRNGHDAATMLAEVRSRQGTAPRRDLRLGRKVADALKAIPEPTWRDPDRRGGGSRLGELRIDWSEFWNSDFTASDWALEPVIARGRNHSLTAKGKTGKSLFVLSVVAPAVLGLASLNRPAGDPLRVLYLDYEMTESDVQDRLAEMGFDESFTPEAFAYLLHPSIPPLDTPGGGMEVLSMAQDHRADVVVIDTYSRAVEGEEDSNDTIRALYRHTLEPLKGVGCAGFRLDHTGHSAQDRARGASGKGDDIDLGWLLTRTDDGFRLKASHRRTAWMPEVVDVRLDHDPLRARLVSGSWPAGTADAAATLDRLGVPVGASQREARRVLREADETMANNVLRAALKYRPTRLEERA
jgi:hypothetical protein